MGVNVLLRINHSSNQQTMSDQKINTDRIHSDIDYNICKYACDQNGVLVLIALLIRWGEFSHIRLFRIELDVKFWHLNDFQHCSSIWTITMLILLNVTAWKIFQAYLLHVIRCVDIYLTQSKGSK